MSAADRVLRADLTDSPLDVDEVAALVTAPAAGAVVTFAGVVRDHDAGRSVHALEYSAHPSAGEVMLAVCAKVAAAHPEVRLAATHRVGMLGIGETAIVCAVASAHRAAAFAACAHLVDAVKARVPIWKHQHFADGSSEWVGAV